MLACDLPRRPRGNNWSFKSTWRKRKQLDGGLRCRHHREHAVGRNTADNSVLHCALRRRELWSHIPAPVKQVRGIWHTSSASRTRWILNTLGRLRLLYVWGQEDTEREGEKKSGERRLCVSPSSIKLVSFFVWWVTSPSFTVWAQVPG